MKLIVNGQALECEATNLGALLIELGYENAIVATARNGDFVSTGARDTQSLHEDDQIEILAPMKGG